MSEKHTSFQLIFFYIFVDFGGLDWIGLAYIIHMVAPFSSFLTPPGTHLVWLTPPHSFMLYLTGTYMTEKSE